MKVFVVCVLFSVAYASVDKCPPGHTEEPVFLANPADCTTFFLCTGGVPILSHCPAGLHWAKELDRCDWPAIANCVETETKPPTKEPETSSPEETEETSVSPSTTRKPYPIECPAKDEPEDVLLKNPADCHSFFKCYRSKPVLIRCPVGQEWADHLKRCDWPEVAQCTVEN